MLILLYFLTWGLLAATAVVRPACFLRPSLWCSLIMTVMIGGAAAFGDDLAEGHPLGPAIRLGALLMPLAVLGWVGFTPFISRLADRLHAECRLTVSAFCRFGKAERKTALLILSLVGLTLAIYLVRVPLAQTGLATIFTNPEQARAAREASFKLLDSTGLKYLFSLHLSAFAPILAGLLWLWRVRWFSGLGALRAGLLIGVILSVSLTGARGPAGILFLTLGLVYLLGRGGARGGLVLGLAAAGALSLAMLLTVAREGQLANFSTDQVEEFALAIGGRAFVTPFVSGLWTNFYADDYGYLGVANIRPLAWLLGVQYISLPSEVAHVYAPFSPPSTLINTCFLFDCQASWGLAGGWVVAFCLLCVLDGLLYCFNRLNGRLLVSLLAAFLIAVFSLACSAFTTCLLSHGILPVAGLAWLCGRLWAGDAQRVSPLIFSAKVVDPAADNADNASRSHGAFDGQPLT